MRRIDKVVEGFAICNKEFEYNSRVEQYGSTWSEDKETSTKNCGLMYEKEVMPNYFLEDATLG